MALKEKLLQTIPSQQLGVFRIGFAVFMLVELVYFLQADFAKAYIDLPFTNLPYSILTVDQPTATTINALMVVLFGASLLVAIGRFYRIAIGVFAVGFSYLFLIDKSIYNNHIYLFCLLAFLLVLMPADRSFVLGKKETYRSPAEVPLWTIWTLRFQVVVVYFFGGVSKLNADWLVHMEPAKTLIASKAARSNVDWFNSDFIVAFTTYGGVVFDLTIGFLLLWKPTRKLAIAGVIFFNLFNAWVFDDINVFPFFMLFATLIFLEPETIAKWLKGKASKNTPAPAKTPAYVLPVLLIYTIIQLYMPLRHYFIPGNADWTGEGQRFAWRMKIYTKEVETFEFQIWDVKNRIKYPGDKKRFLNSDQITQMANDPHMVWKMAQFLGERARTVHKLDQIYVTANLVVSMNGRPPAPVVSPELDLLTVEWDKTGHNDWLNPVPEHASK